MGTSPYQVFQMPGSLLPILGLLLAKLISNDNSTSPPKDIDASLSNFNVSASQLVSDPSPFSRTELHSILSRLDYIPAAQSCPFPDVWLQSSGPGPWCLVFISLVTPIPSVIQPAWRIVTMSRPFERQNTQ